VLLFLTCHSTNAGFRISLTGTALEQRATPQVVKKLKLVGTPTKIYKNSAFITGTCSALLCLYRVECGVELRLWLVCRGLCYCGMYQCKRL
jgi:ribosome biogenesis protein BMS1